MHALLQTGCRLALISEGVDKALVFEQYPVNCNTLF